MLAVMGHKSELDAFGGDLSRLVVVESDGSYQLIDVLRMCGEHEVSTPLTLQNASLEEFAAYAARLYPPTPAQCLKCLAYRGCGGGYLPHRYDGTGYSNTSFFCPVLLELYMHIKRHIQSVTPVDVWKPGEVIE